MDSLCRSSFSNKYGDFISIEKVFLLLITAYFLSSASTVYAHCKSYHPHHCVEDVVKGTAEEIEEAGEDIGDFVKDAGEDIEDEAKRIEKDVGRSLKDIEKTVIKALDDTAAETERGLKNVEEAVHAIGHYIENQAKSTEKTISNAESRVRGGKVFDAIWHLAVDPIRNSEENAAMAVQESSLLNTVGQTAASAYGGPGGAAAYACWYTYKQTGDADLALRVGIITGATSAASSHVSKISSDQLTKKVVVGAAIGGLAVAAAGGDENAIRDGFIRGGGMILIQDGYRRLTQQDLDGQSSRGEAYCMATVGEECSPPDHAYIRDKDGNIKLDRSGKPLVDIRQTDPRRPHVGTWATSGEPTWDQERSAFMTSVSRVPGMNAMSVFHDQWAISWDMSALQSKATIAPAIVLTYTGTGAPLYDLIQDTAVTADQPTSQRSGIKNQNTKDIEISSNRREERLGKATEASFICVHGNRTRHIASVGQSQDGKYACRVLYENQHGVSIPWYAKNEHDYCYPKAVHLVSKQIAWGWQCFGRESVPNTEKLGNKVADIARRRTR